MHVSLIQMPTFFFRYIHTHLPRNVCVKKEDQEKEILQERKKV